MFPETVRTDRLRLERFDEAVDAHELYDHAGRSETIDEETRYLSWTPHAHPKESRDVLSNVAESWENGEAATWAIYPREGEDGAGEYAGNCGMEFDWDKRVAYFGIWLRKPFWGRGYSGERAAAFMDVAFDRLDLDVVSAGHYPENENSKRAIRRYVERFGGREDGRLRNWTVVDGDPRDLHTYSVSQEEWRAAEDRPEVRYE